MRVLVVGAGGVGGYFGARVFDAGTGRFRFALPHDEWVRSLGWAPDSRRVVTGGTLGADGDARD